MVLLVQLRLKLFDIQMVEQLKILLYLFLILFHVLRIQFLIMQMEEQEPQRVNQKFTAQILRYLQLFLQEKLIFSKVGLHLQQRQLRHISLAVPSQQMLIQFYMRFEV